MKKRRRLTRARLRELLDYDSDTGEFRWRKRFGNAIRHGDLAGYVNIYNGLCFIRIEGRAYPAHQLAYFYMTGRWGKPTIDHRDGNPANNRWSNLRRATRSQNNANRRRPRHNTSGYKGVHLCRTSRKWRARISRNGKMIDLGGFSAPKAAHAAYAAAARKLFGEFARPD